MAGGGTGGHLYPGIAVARELLRRDPSAVVSFVGTARGIESRVVPREGFALDLIRVAGLKGMSRLNRARGALLLPLAGTDAWRVITRRRPDVVVGVGGFASGPVVLLAALRGRPTMLLEQNAMPGLTNRLLARWVRAAAVNFEESLRFFPRTGFVAGNPVRPEFFTREDDDAVDPGGRQAALAQGAGASAGGARVLIFGGSQGAHAINVAMVEAAARLGADGLRLAITHQTGERDRELVRDAYERAGIPARVEAFIYQMDREMKQAQLVVSRSGATTLAELAAAGRPAVLIPLPTSTDDHQRSNAAAVARAGAAVVIDERDLTADRLAGEIRGLIADSARRTAMAAAARTLARPDAAARIVEKLLALAGVAGVSGVGSREPGVGR
jgi:UDP-N-acetylglucosamine--N-acetylmuramyl-(pentapeptide) pyrophosphoryl-undecaprenol N-acetylglucosamine transferase